MLRACVRNLAPPILYRALQTVRRPAEVPAKSPLHENVQFRGNFGSWGEALRASQGYAAPQVLQRVRESTGKVRDGLAASERDGVCFDTPQWNFPQLACLAQIAARRHGTLRVLDFGGSLGGSYFQFRDFTGREVSLRWSVVEQSQFVDCGQAEFQDDSLRFYYTVEECLAGGEVDVLLLSGVIQCIEAPEAMLRHLLHLKIPYLLFDRTPFLEAYEPRLTIQHVPAWIYGTPITYPAWFFAKGQFRSLWEPAYDELCRFTALDGSCMVEGQRATYEGFLLTRSAGAPTT